MALDYLFFILICFLPHKFHRTIWNHVSQIVLRATCVLMLLSQEVAVDLMSF